MAGGHRTIAGKLREKHGVSEVLSKQRLALDSDSSLHTDSLVSVRVRVSMYGVFNLFIRNLF